MIFSIKKSDGRRENQRSYWKLAWRQLRKNRLAMGALVVLILLYVLMAVSVPLTRAIAYDYKEIYVGERNSVTIGMFVGSIAGLFGGWVDSLLMRLVDVVLCFPFLFLAIIIVTILSPNFFNVVLAIGLLAWTGVARIVRANILSLKERDFFLAGRAIGVNRGRLIFRYLLPNTAAPIIVNATLSVAGAILAETGLSFLGLGVQPPTPTWGNILMAGKSFLTMNIYYTLFPGLFIFITVMAINVLGDGLRDALDPRVATRE